MITSLLHVRQNVLQTALDQLRRSVQQRSPYVYLHTYINKKAFAREREGKSGDQSTECPHDIFDQTGHAVSYEEAEAILLGDFC